MQLPLIQEVSSTWEAPNLADLPSWRNAKRVAIDCETRDPDLKQLGPGGGRRTNSYVVGVSFAIEDGPSAYLPIRHEGGGNLPIAGVLQYLKDQAKEYTHDIVGANLPYDLDFLAEEGIVFDSVRRFRDVQIADPLIYELHQSYSLQNIADRWGLEGKNEEMLRRAALEFGINPKSQMWKLPAKFVGAYAEQDAVLPLHVLRKQEREIENQELEEVYLLESKLLPILTKLRRKGVRIHQGRLEKVEHWASEREKEELAKIRHLTGKKILSDHLWKAAALEPLFTHLGIKLNKTATGKPQIDSAFLDSLDNPVIAALKQARKINKLRTTFCESVKAHMVNGRIHCTFNQLKGEKEREDETTGAAYGRLSCRNPNLQQQPARGEFAQMWRAIYIPEEGSLWASNDYSQQEPRMAVHYASICPELIGAYAHKAAIRARDHYRNDPNADNHQMMADMAGISRKEAKNIYLGLCYGMGGAKLAQELGLPTRFVVRGPEGKLVDVDSELGKQLCDQGAFQWLAAGSEGQALLDEFDRKVPFIKKLAQACQKRAKSVGYIMTLSGRRCRFPKDKDGNFDWTHKALNRLIQGSSADQTKLAMIALEENGFDMIIQVHDEIALNVADIQEAEKAAEIMRTCVDLEVPTRVDVEVGISWGHSMGWEGE